MARFIIMLMAMFAVISPTHAWADPQYRLLVVAIPNKYHYEYIPVARTVWSILPSCMTLP
jgi:hypothetical protein